MVRLEVWQLDLLLLPSRTRPVTAELFVLKKNQMVPAQCFFNCSIMNS
jgi:hypothetical protein